MKIIVDPTDLIPEDVVISISDYDEHGCHCDVMVTVERQNHLIDHARRHYFVLGLPNPALCGRPGCGAVQETWVHMSETRA